MSFNWTKIENVEHFFANVHIFVDGTNSDYNFLSFVMDLPDFIFDQYLCIRFSMWLLTKTDVFQAAPKFQGPVPQTFPVCRQTRCMLRD